MVLACVAGSQSAQVTPKLPLRVSESRRYLVDAQGQPAFLQGDAAWFLPFRLKQPEIQEYFRARRAMGFNATIIDILDESPDPTRRNVHGEMAFEPAGDLSKPNERYFSYLDDIVAEAERQGMILFLTVTYLGYNQDHWAKWLDSNGVMASAEFAGWLARRYADRSNILWVLGGDADPKMRYDLTDHIQAQGEAIKKANPKALITYHDFPNNDDYQFQDAEWHDLVWTYTYQTPTTGLARKYYTSSPIRPVYLAETGYDGLDKWNATTVRHQTYGAWLGGATAGVFYGSRLHYFPEDWRTWLHVASAKQVEILGNIARSLAWWELVPDMKDSVFESGQFPVDDPKHVAVSLSQKGDLLVAYFPPSREPDLSVTLGANYRDATNIRWIDPTNGATQTATLSGREVKPPGRNAAGETDWLWIASRG